MLLRARIIQKSRLSFWGFTSDITPTTRSRASKAARLAARLGQVEVAHKQYLRLARDNPSNPVVFVRLARFCKQHKMLQCYYDAKDNADLLRGTKVERRDLRPLRKSRR